jgi:hypothetical protein
MGGKAPQRRQRPGVTPRLWPPLWAIALVLLLVLVGAGGVYWALTLLLDLPATPSNIAQRRLPIEGFKVAVAIAAGLGAVVALTLNYRRHRIEQSQSHRDDQRLFTDRFQAAAEQLGHEQPAVRLAGVHAMARLADDWDEQRQTCIDVLCAYLRLPPMARTQPAPVAATPPEELEIRQTIVRLIGDHLRIDPSDETRVGWHGHDFDFTGVAFDDGESISGRRSSPLAR